MAMRYQDDAQLPQVSLDELRARLGRTQPFTIVILHPGPRFEPPDEHRSEEISGIVMQHGLRNYALHRAGLLPVVCPVADGSEVCGIGIFDAPPDDVERIMSADPAVRAGVLTYDVHPTRAFPGSVLGAEPAGAATE
jgi:hypothetical protein